MIGSKSAGVRQLEQLPSEFGFTHQRSPRRRNHASSPLSRPSAPVNGPSADGEVSGADPSGQNHTLRSGESLSIKCCIMQASDQSISVTWYASASDVTKTSDAIN